MKRLWIGKLYEEKWFTVAKLYSRPRYALHLGTHC